MATPERDTVYDSDRSQRPVYVELSSATGWFVGIVVALAILAIGYLVFSANTGTQPAGEVNINNTPTIEAPATPAPATDTTPMVDQSAPATPAPADTAPANTAPADTAPATDATPAQ